MFKYLASYHPPNIPLGLVLILSEALITHHTTHDWDYLARYERDRRYPTKKFEKMNGDCK